jgi:ribose transport system ATP-binding protein
VAADINRSVALDIRRLSKRFGGAVALDDVSLSIRRGEVHGLLGSNGSGKSTLIKVLSGFHTPEAGAELTLYGRKLSLPVKSSRLSEHGLSFVHQHLGLIPGLSVTENLYLGKLSSEDNWAINWTAAHENAHDVFDRFELDLEPTMDVGMLSPVQQALLAIVRAYMTLQQSAENSNATDRPGVLVLDEPTPFLPRSGVEQLFQLIRQCVATGASVIFVSHDVDEVREITDRSTILRDGHLIDTVTTADTSHEAFVSRIIGRSLEDYAGGKNNRQQSAVRLSVDGAVLNTALKTTGPLSFTVQSGEILGITGLIGSGFDDVPALLYGAHKKGTGTLSLSTPEGQTQLHLADLTPARALRAGIAYLPADRLGEAGIGSLSVGDNVALPVLDRLRGKFALTEQQIQTHAASLGASADVKPNVPQLPLAALSGGNAQKALMAKWLQTRPQVLLLDEPTQGVDVGARQQLWDALDQTAAGGTAVLIASTDYEQLASVCHRVLIFSQGQIVATLTGQDLTKDLIAEYCYRSMTGSTGTA